MFCAVAVMLTGVVLCPSPVSGAAAAAGPQTAAQRSAHQTCPEDHEVPAAAQGEKQSTAVLLITPTHTHRHTCRCFLCSCLTHSRVRQRVVNTQARTQTHKHTNTQTHTHMSPCVETLMTHRTYCLFRLLSSQRGRGKLHN